MSSSWRFPILSCLANVYLAYDFSVSLVRICANGDSERNPHL